MSISQLSAILFVEPVVYLRKLNRRSDWGISGDPRDGRVAHAAERVFETDPTSKYSLYRVRSSVELQRVAVGLNGNRHSLVENLDLISFTPDELSTCGIVLTETAGETRCLAANRLHVDVEASKDQLTRLCRLAMDAGRSSARVSKSIMRGVASELTTFGCHATTDAADHPCGCESD
ncbi:MAG: hypothetical protein WDZ51_01825 [Pirellulaceae bacterium]